MPKQKIQYLSNMEAVPSFHPGYMPRRTKEEKRRYEREKKRQKLQKEMRKNKPQFFIRCPVWRILPCQADHAFLIDTLSGKTYFEKMKSLEDYGSFLTTKSTLFPNFKPNQELKETIFQMKKACKSLMAENQILRWKFKRFITKWRMKRFKQINDTDFITLSEIQKTVKIYNYPTRCIYTFEASSILQDIHKKLLNHDGQIPHPLFPRNPYTNEQFTISQLLSVQTQCKKYEQAVWTLESFYKSKMKIDTFSQIHRKALRLHALKSILFHVKDFEGIYLLLNFIESQHDEHEAQFNKPLYRWCLSTIPDDSKIQSWRYLCKEYYEEEILAEDDVQRELCFARIARKTGYLCAPPYDLIAKKKLFSRIK
jgi:hypothetical protein